MYARVYVLDILEFLSVRVIHSQYPYAICINIRSKFHTNKAKFA